MAVSRGALASALLALTTTSALAIQDIGVTDEAGETVLFQADAVVRDLADGPIVATGNVRATYGGRVLTARRLTYDPATDQVTASGDVAIYETDGTVAYADEAVLTGDLADGVASGFSAVLAGDSRLAASSVVRRSSGVNDLNNAVYTACEVCTEEGDARTPTWQIKALRVTQDQENQTIRFRNAVVEVLGVPVFYTPYVAIPDPSVKRKSGFLTPKVAVSSRLGFEAEVPYYWAISDYQDATFSPRHMTELGTLIQGEYRLRTHDAGLVVQAGFIDPREDLTRRVDTKTGAYVPDGAADPFGNERDLRGHFFGQAFKELRGGWLGEIDVNTVTDDNYLRFYDVEPTDRLQDALDVIKPDRLTSELAFTRPTDRGFTDISAISFQSLRLSDDDDYQANALPRLTHVAAFPVPRLGGEVELLGNLLYLDRKAGLDTTRGVVSATYQRSHTTRGGHRLRGFAQLRGDAYRYEDANLGIESCNPGPLGPAFDSCRDLLPRNGEDDGFTTTRMLPTIGAEWSLPLVRLDSTATYILEPRVQLVLSPDRDDADAVFNEDSQTFQFDTVSLFDWSKASGFDAWEDGQRLNVGLAATAVYANGLQVSGLVGQQVRTRSTDVFDEDVGLGTTVSDLVGEASIRYGSRLTWDNRFRFDRGDGTMNRGESTLRGHVGRLSGAASYLRVEDQRLTASGARDEFLTASAAYQFTDRWTLGGGFRENLATGETTAQSVLLTYRDQCALFSLSYRLDNAAGGRLDQNRTLTFNIDLLGF